MRYTTQISASHLERQQVKEAGQKSNIILFLIRDNDSILEASSEDRYEFIYSLEPSPDFNP